MSKVSSSPTSPREAPSSLHQTRSRSRTYDRSVGRPQFHTLRQTTSDHIDSVVVDEWEHHHPLDEEEEGEEDDDDDDDRAPPRRDVEEGGQGMTTIHTVVPGGARFRNGRLDDSSDQTLHDGPAAQHNKEGKQLNEDGQGIEKHTGSDPRKRGRSTTQGSGRWKDPETREWKDDIVTWDSRDDPNDPKNWPFGRKVTVTMLFGLTTMCSTFASSVFSPALSYISVQYGISSEVAILGISLFVLGYVPGPVIFAPLSELYGRKISVLVPMFIFMCFSAATATATNIQTIMITRFFAGVMASAPVSNVGGGLADMFNQKERATAVVFYSLAVVAGPCLGPIIGAAVSQSYLGWRWSEYLVVILTAFILALDVYFLPETFAPVLLTRKARKLRWKTKRWSLHSRQEMNEVNLKTFMRRNLLLPLRMIVLEPMVLCITTFNSFVYGILYLLFAAVPIVYEEGRGWNSLVGSLPFLAVLLGALTAAGINIAYSQRVFAPYMERNGGKAEPEMRLPPMMLGSVLFPIGFFLLGWTSKPSIHWFPSTLGLYFVGTSFLLIFQAGINTLIDTYTQWSASAIAANTFMRSLFAAALPLVARPMFHNLGVDWACTLLGCIAILLAGIPFIFFKYGKKLRSMSKLATD